MNDISIIYYTSNRIEELVGERIRQQLLITAQDIPIVSVSQKPLDFGQNICVGNIGVSKSNIYKQIYTGAKAANTKYIACCEDDTFYNIDHFSYRPKEGIFAYDCNMWFADHNEFWRRPVTDIGPNSLRRRSGMFGCIVEKKTILDFLDGRWAEPEGIYYEGKFPLIVFIHGIPGKSRKEQQKRKLLDRHKRESFPEDHVQCIEPYGDIKKLWESIWTT
jgi:hypothetical protein